jgi:murein DD-endopeptidase MepM/ murein hydrolase activator NlpD
VKKAAGRNWRSDLSVVAKAIGGGALFGLLALAPAACDTGTSKSLAIDYLPRSAHQAYGYSLAQARLSQTALGRLWIGSSERALQDPGVVQLPYTVEGRFEPGLPQALGFRFAVGASRRLAISVALAGDEPFETFADLFTLDAQGRLQRVASAAPRRMPAADPRYAIQLELEVYEPGDYILRVQPELLAAGSYELSIAAGPVLAFPVSGYDRRAIQSVFGAERDGGRRAHRGVDIFAKRGTDALAAVDAWVARVDTTPRGGNVVWLQPLFGNMRLYYAHLDTQLVTAGQFVAAGDVLGTVGNTGNAITTPPHLHFGVYLRTAERRGGARDPYGFLN